MLVATLRPASGEDAGFLRDMLYVALFVLPITYQIARAFRRLLTYGVHFKF